MLKKGTYVSSMFSGQHAKYSSLILAESFRVNNRSGDNDLEPELLGGLGGLLRAPRMCAAEVAQVCVPLVRF